MAGNEKKKLIASRLMQISLKVDDYVYKNVSISAKRAALFIKEVSGYIDKCYKDKRSLQVIEKLIRCMKGIIAEQRELQGSGTETDDVTLVDVEGILSTSVDEEVANHTHNIDIDKILESTKNGIETIDLSDDSTDIDNHFHKNVIVDLCKYNKDKNEKDKIKNQNKRDRSSNEHLQKGISNLTIGGKDDRLSQSILNDVDICVIEIGKKQITNSIGCNQDFEAIIQPATIIKEYDKAITNVASTNITKNHRLKIPNITKLTNDDLFTMSAINTEDNCNTNKNIFNKNVQRKRRQKTTPKPSKDNERKISKKSVKKNKQKKKEIVDQNVIAKRALNEIHKTREKICKTEGIKKLQGPTQNKIRNDNGYNKHGSAEIKSNPKNIFNDKPGTNTINDVANDLSWIENIRYVREITVEEKIPASHEDSFWENYALPNDWNNDDFLYS